MSESMPDFAPSTSKKQYVKVEGNDENLELENLEFGNDENLELENKKVVNQGSFRYSKVICYISIILNVVLIIFIILHSNSSSEYVKSCDSRKQSEETSQKVTVIHKHRSNWTISCDSNRTNDILYFLTTSSVPTPKPRPSLSVKERYGPEEWYVISVGRYLSAELLKYDSQTARYTYDWNCGNKHFFFRFYDSFLHIQEESETWNKIDYTIKSIETHPGKGNCNSHWEFGENLTPDQMKNFEYYLRENNKTAMHYFLKDTITFDQDLNFPLNCFMDERVLFVGDSHTATIFEGLKEHVTGRSQPHLKLDSRVEHYPNNFHAHFTHVGIPDPEQIKRYIQEHQITILIWNSGQHPASGSYHYTFERYNRMISNIMLGLKSTTNHFIFETVAFPPRDDEFVQNYKDWRTNTRLLELNRILNENAILHGLKVIPTFQMTLPMIFTTLDKAHYQGFVRQSLMKRIMKFVCNNKKPIFTN